MGNYLAVEVCEKLKKEQLIKVEILLRYYVVIMQVLDVQKQT